MDIVKHDFEIPGDDRDMKTRLAEVVDFLSLKCGNGEYHMMNSVDDAATTIARLTAEVERLRDGLNKVNQSAQITLDEYSKNGPEWSSRDGEEYYSASYVLEGAREVAEYAKAALAAREKEDSNGK